MGQKIRPNLHRLSITENWKSRWWPKKKYGDQLEEDMIIRAIVNKQISTSGIVHIEIERTADNAFKIFLKVARPGLVIGRGGKGIEELSKAIEQALNKVARKKGNKNPKTSINLNVEELKRSEVSAQYIAQLIAWDLEKRISSRRTIRKYLEQVMQNRDVQGAKILLSGRIDGNEIARREVLAKGKLPLQTIRANIDYGEAPSYNTYGTIGVKVWIYKGEVFKEDVEKNRHKRISN
jgi:small subunit ribosomal protein S3